MDSFVGVRHGALTVIETPRSRDDINLQLRELHAGLFCEKQLTRERESVWCVVIDAGASGLITLYEFRDPEGRPIPHLSDRIVEEMKRRYQRGPITAKDIVAANEAMVAKANEEWREEAQERTREYFESAQRSLPSLMGSSPKVLKDRRRKRATGHYEKAGQ